MKLRKVSKHHRTNYICFMQEREKKMGKTGRVNAFFLLFFCWFNVCDFHARKFVFNWSAFLEMSGECCVVSRKQ